jgi:hypothetical protein
MGQVWVDLEQEFDIELDDNQINEFCDKYKDIVDLFGGNFLKKDSNGDIALLGEMSFSINSQDWPRSCVIDENEVNLSLARARFLSIRESSNAEFGWGSTEGFGENFYKDLKKLLDTPDDGFYATATVSGDNGYSSGTYEWGEKGFIVHFQYYEYEEDSS